MPNQTLTQPLCIPVDMRGGLIERPQRQILMRGDKNAVQVTALLMDGEESYDATGMTCTGKFTRCADGIDIQLEGETDENRASVTLDEHCFAAAGRYELRIRLTMGSITRTVLYISGHVESDGEGGILDVENVIPSIDDIVAQYAEMKRVTRETEAARDAAILASQQANIRILGRYSTYSELMAMHPTGEAGQAYAVGTAEDNDIYIWNVYGQMWQNIGPIHGPQGVTGAQGPKGADGVSPTVTVTTITGGHRVSIKDAGGTKTFDVMDGADGADGEDGKDGEGTSYNQSLNTTDAVTFKTVTANAVYGAVFME